MSASLVAIARHLNFVRETQGPNRGAWVEFFQRFCDGVPGDSWCADFESIVENIALMGKIVTPRTGSTQTKLAFCRAHKLIVTIPKPEDLFFYVHPDGTAHHIGIVTAVTYPAADKVSNPVVIGIAGNTNEAAASSNGDGVYEHPITVDQNTIYARIIS